MREYLRRPGLGLRLVNLPGYSPDFNADGSHLGMGAGEATGNLCLGSRAAVQERVGSSPGQADQPERRGQAPLPHGLQSRAESLLRDSQPDPRLPANAHPTLALV